MLGWRRFVLAVVGGFGAIIAGLAIFILLMNPYGNLPKLVFREHAITDINQRFQYPALIRSGRYDSIVVGASDARLLRPEMLDQAFGGHFANLSMNAGQAWEQYRLVDLYLRQPGTPRMLLLGLDRVWCEEDAAEERTTFRGFPDWMYDDNKWNDLGYMLNQQTVEISARRLAVAAGFKPARFPDGYEVFTPPENAYDKVKVRNKLWGKEGPHEIEAVTPPYVPSDAERASWQFPALPWLEDILTRFPGRQCPARRRRRARKHARCASPKWRSDIKWPSSISTSSPRSRRRTTIIGTGCITASRLRTGSSLILPRR